MRNKSTGSGLTFIRPVPTEIITDDKEEIKLLNPVENYNNLKKFLIKKYIR